MITNTVEQTKTPRVPMPLSPYTIQDIADRLVQFYGVEEHPNTSNEQEGIVIRPQEEFRSKVLDGRMSFKVISNRYLLKEGD